MMDDGRDQFVTQREQKSFCGMEFGEEDWWGSRRGFEGEVGL